MIHTKKMALHHGAPTKFGSCGVNSSADASINYVLQIITIFSERNAYEYHEEGKYADSDLAGA